MYTEWQKVSGHSFADLKDLFRVVQSGPRLLGLIPSNVAQCLRGRSDDCVVGVDDPHATASRQRQLSNASSTSSNVSQRLTRALMKATTVSPALGGACRAFIELLADALISLKRSQAVGSTRRVPLENSLTYARPECRCTAQACHFYSSLPARPIASNERRDN